MDFKEIKQMERKCKQIRKEDNVLVKSLITAMGCHWLDAPGEADVLCAYLARQGHVWGTLSEDMDLFLYGCPHVLRYCSLFHHTVVHYDTHRILQELGTTEEEFQFLCLLSGNDFQEETMPLSTCFERFYDSKETLWRENSANILPCMETIHRLLSVHLVPSSFSFSEQPVQLDLLRDMLRKEGFLFNM
jgi:hypothetical protein